MPDKVVIITGASSGFGKLTALEAARKGYKVVITARRVERLQELADQITAAGGAVLTVPGDINDESVQQQLIDGAIERFGRIDILLNNAGVPLAENFAPASLEDLRRQWNTNTTSLILLTKRALPELMRAQGIVINVSSSISRFSVPMAGLYAPSKVAVSSISDALRRELEPQGVRVCIVEPGPYNTEFAQNAGMPPDQQFSLDPQDVVDAIIRLFERPKRMTVVPGWLRPLIAVGGGLMSLLPGVVDLVFFAIAKRQQRKEQQQATT